MKKIFILAAATLALTACNNDNNDVDEPVAAQITASIGQSAETRASETSWASNDTIGITMGDRYTNMAYTTENGNGIFTGTTMYFKNKTEPVTLTAYYPFAGPEGTAPGIIETSTTSDYQTADEQPKFDFLYAKAENIKGSDPNVKFEFSHQMSKITLIFKNGNGADVNKIASYQIDGLILNGTFNTATGECAATNTDPAPLSITMGTVPSLIVFPQGTDNKEVKLTISDSDGQNYACTLSFEDNFIKSGNNYQFTITVNKTGLTVNQSTITEWTTKTSEANADAV